MKLEILPFAPALPSYWQAILRSEKSPIQSQEALLAWVELDLDASLRFNKSLLLLTDQILLWTDGQNFESWAVNVAGRLVHGDHAGEIGRAHV